MDEDKHHEIKRDFEETFVDYNDAMEPTDEEWQEFFDIIHEIGQFVIMDDD
jgi:hypothetical protein